MESAVHDELVVECGNHPMKGFCKQEGIKREVRSAVEKLVANEVIARLDGSLGNMFCPRSYQNWQCSIPSAVYNKAEQVMLNLLPKEDIE